jgi:hypothetical protein
MEYNMKLRSPLFLTGVLLSSFALSACCQQPGYSGGGSNQQAGNCHTHNENSAKGSTRHCHPHKNGANHSHRYGQSAARQQPTYQAPAQYPRALSPTVKNKGYYKGTVGDMMHPTTRQALEQYRQY